MDDVSKSPVGEFAKATTVKQIADAVWQGDFSEDWLIGQTLNGGYAMSIGARALAEALPHPDPISVNGFFLGRTVPGPVRCEVEILREGGATSTGVVKLIQEGELKIQMTGVYGDADKQKGETIIREPIPPMLDLDECVDAPIAGNHKLRERLMQRMAPANVQSLVGDPEGSGVWHAWLDFADGSDKDLFSLIMFADALPPPVFSFYGARGWVPTLDLSVQIHGRPQSGPLRCVFRTNVMTESIVNEEGVIWDSSDKIVALARQTAKYRLPK